ncbi:MAG TPA: ABC transporter permease [Cyclobacteriaceae bacterium]|nr:ABC transporter permease [Cyclobacteriaceae bacterium]
MLLNFWKVALRNLIKNRSYVLISTLGMGIAIACCLTAYLLVAYNMEFDDFYPDNKVANVVKVLHTYRISDNENGLELETPMAIAPRIREDIAGIEDLTRFCNGNAIISHNSEAFYETIRFADASFFQMFGLTVTEGATSSFDDLNTIILSPTLAKKYFGNEPATGKMLTVELNSKKYEVVVGGVLEEIPLNTSFHIHALMRIERFLEAHDVKIDDWASSHTSTLLMKLTDINNRSDIARQMSQYSKLVNDASPNVTSVSYELVPFRQPIMQQDIAGSELRLPIPYVALIVFTTLGVLILLIACFNLTNTTLAITSKRMKEIGIRKVVGSGKRQIVVQLLFEIMIMVLIAIGSAAALSTFIVPRFCEMWGLQYGLSDLNGTNVLLVILLLLFVVSVVAGLYPAIYNSRLNAVVLFKGAKARGTTIISRILLTGQFALSAIVLIGGITFTQNAAYQADLDFGYDHEDILVLSTGQQANFNGIRDAVARQSSVVANAGAANGIGPYSRIYITLKIDTGTFKSNLFRVGPGYINTVGIDVLEGREFTEGEADLESAIIDENFVKNHTLNNPLGTQITYEDKKYRVIGVVSNHISGFKESSDTEHIFLAATPGDYSSLFIRTLPGQTEAVRKSIANTWKQLSPDKPFQCSTQDEIIYEEANSYNKNLKDIFFFLTVLGSLLAGSGIYSLASLNANKRKKEIGVRKVLGAGVMSIVQLLNREFAIVLACATVIGGVAGYALTNTLLGSLYSQFISAGAFSIAVSVFAIMGMGLLVTSSTIARAATSNPVDSLRTE